MNTVDAKDFEARRSLAVRLVHEGIRRATEMQKSAAQALKTDATGLSTYQTDADTELEAYYTAEIMRNFPEDVVIGEEGQGHDLSDRNNGRFTWVLDPVDGTGNYALRLDPWASSVAVHRNNHPVVAVVGCGTLVFSTHADLDHVVTTTGERHVRVAGKTKKMTISTECLEWLPEGERLFRELAKQKMSFRSLGSSIGTCALVLDGRLDAFLHAGLALWDHAAISLLFYKGGLCFRRWNGELPFPAIWERVRSNPKLYCKDDVYRFDMLAATPQAYGVLQPILAQYAGYRDSHNGGDQ